MTRYTVRVLDGDSEGKSIDLPSEGSFTIGRKPGCDLVLTGDDKISGKHAEIAVEAGMLLLRDLGSTNGTRVDSRRIQEIPVSHGDRFQVGATQLQLIDSDAPPLPDESMSLEIDAAALKRSSRKSPVALLVLVLILVSGGLGYWYLNSTDAGTGTRQKLRKVATIPGNRLSPAAAHAEQESDDWLPLSEGAAFQRAGRGNTGRSSFEAQLEITDETGPSGGFAVAMQAVPLALKPKRYRASAWFRTDGDVRVGLRLCFFRDAAPAKKPEDTSGDDADRLVFTRRPELVVGPSLTKLSKSGFQKLQVEASAPVGFKEVAVALVAVLPIGQTEAASVNVDDIALVEAGRRSDPIEIAGRSVIVPDEDMSSLQTAVGLELSLASVTGVADGDKDPVLESLSSVLPLPLTDVLGARVHDIRDDIWIMNGPPGGMLTLHVPAKALAGGTFFARKKIASSEGFEQSSGAGEVSSVTGLLWGGSLTRAFVRWPEPATVQVASDDAKGLRFTLPFRGVLELELGFQDQGVRAKNLARIGRDARAAHELGKALRAFGEVIRSVPFDEQALREAQQARAELLRDAEMSLQDLRSAFQEADAFGYQGLYVDVLSRIEEVAKVYEGTEFEPQLAELRRKVEDRYNERQVARNEEQAKRLRALQEALVADKLPGLAKLVEGYLNKQFPKSGPRNPAPGQQPNKNPDKHESEGGK